MSDFEDKVETHKEKALALFEKWDEEESGAKVFRRLLNKKKGDSTTLDNLWQQLNDIATNSEDDNLRKNTIMDIFRLAAGNEGKGNQTNVQVNISELLNNTKD